MGGSQAKEEDIQAAQEFIDNEIKSNKVMVFSKSYCPFCNMAKSSLKDIGIDFHFVELDKRDDGDLIQDLLAKMTGARTVPRVFVNGQCIGGGTETKALANSGELKKMIDS